MNRNAFQITMRFPKHKSGHFVVTYKVSIDGMLRTFIGQGATQELARQDAERQVLRYTDAEHPVAKFRNARMNGSAAEDAPF